MITDLPTYLDRNPQKRYACPVCDSSDGLSVQPGEGRGVGPDAERDAVGYAYCFACGRHWNAVDWLVAFERYDALEAMEALGMEETRAQYGANASTGDTVPEGKRKPILRPTKVSRPPGDAWQSEAARIRAKATKALRAAIDGNGSPFATACVRALRDRGISDMIMYTSHLGCLETKDWTPAENWDVDPSNTRYGEVGLPRGVVIPWAVDDMTGDVWTLRVRKPNGDVSEDSSKYAMPKGGRQTGLYLWGRVPSRAVVLVEGELDALHIASVAEEVCTPVATGSTTGARRAQHVALLRSADVVLVAYDNEGGIEDACRWWLDRVPNAVRWKPIGAKDPCDMHRAGIDTRAWIEAGIKYATATTPRG